MDISIILKIKNMKSLIVSVIMVLSLTAFGQDYKVVTTEKIPIEVEFAFQKQFPNTIAVWSTTYEGDDEDQLVYVGKFEINTVKNAAMFYKDGQFKALEISLIGNELPLAVNKYMKKNYPKTQINEASKTIDSNAKVIYEVGIIRDGVFYDLVFDADGDFLQMLRKD